MNLWLNYEQEKGFSLMKQQKEDRNSEAIRFLLAVLQVVMTAIAAYAATEIKDMSKSINTLNVQIASVLTDMTNEKSELRRLDQRINDLEYRQKGR